MVLAELLRRKYLEPLREKKRERWRQEAIAKIRAEIIAEVHLEWSQWNDRRLEAEAAGVPFNEPSPGQKKSTNN